MSGAPASHLAASSRGILYCPRGSSVRHRVGGQRACRALCCKWSRGRGRTRGHAQDPPLPPPWRLMTTHGLQRRALCARKGAGRAPARPPRLRSSPGGDVTALPGEVSRQNMRQVAFPPSSAGQTAFDVCRQARPVCMYAYTPYTSIVHARVFVHFT